jgi:hypothetical protein
MNIAKWSVLTLLLMCLSNCTQREPPSLTGTWRTVGGQSPPITLELKEDGTFIRKTTFNGIEVKSGGHFTVDIKTIRFHLGIEQIGGRSVEKDAGTIGVPYELRRTTLVLYPYSSREENYLLIR